MGQGFRGVKCRESKPVAEFARIRTISQTIRILANSATNVDEHHLGSRAPMGPTEISPDTRTNSPGERPLGHCHTPNVCPERATERRDLPVPLQGTSIRWIADPRAALAARACPGLVSSATSGQKRQLQQGRRISAGSQSPRTTGVIDVADYDTGRTRIPARTMDVACRPDHVQGLDEACDDCSL